ncbi:hypothetical protein BXZ70DRAFT_595079 [Cristinia sonorae]|uniref:Uncharacterized protein n=1 Tax=Cristinia sonorae TaxID=1940300 RepID=A0A8K0UTY7_9AGAR|nr:hypothetical protein BXZ70DRAFT_595079 [Cristinia sonorae]
MTRSIFGFSVLTHRSSSLLTVTVVRVLYPDDTPPPPSSPLSRLRSRSPFTPFYVLSRVSSPPPVAMRLYASNRIYCNDVIPLPCHPNPTKGMWGNSDQSLESCFDITEIQSQYSRSASLVLCDVGVIVVPSRVLCALAECQMLPYTFSFQYHHIHTSHITRPSLRLGIH